MSDVVTPTAWPKWASTESGEQVWVRPDIDTAWVLSELSGWGCEDVRLVERGPQVMYLDLEDTRWADEWMLVPAHDEQADEVQVYRLFDVVDDYSPSTGAQGERCDLCGGPMLMVDRPVLGPRYWECQTCGKTDGAEK